MTESVRGGPARADLVVSGASELLRPDPARPGRVERVPGGIVACAGQVVIAAGSPDEVRAACDTTAAETVDAAGGIVLPGFVDCHTHLLFGGSRAQEYAARVAGDSAGLEQIAAEKGGLGIRASVAMTRSASDEEILRASIGRLDRQLAQGTTTVESKTGYGLDVASELRLLELNRRLDAESDVDVVSTLMAAHDMPPEADGTRRGVDRWIDAIVRDVIPAAAELGAEFNDVFCDEGFFTVEQSRRVLEAGLEAGLAAKIHADQYARIGAAELAVELGVVSADHLNYTERPTLERLAAAGVVGVLMPLIDFAVAHPRPVDGREWVGAGLRPALATDLCPGGWAVSMPLAMQFACRVHRLGAAEALWAATAGGAAALDRTDRGALAPGLLADVIVIDVPSLEELVYRLGHAPVTHVVRRGRLVAGAAQ